VSGRIETDEEKESIKFVKDGGSVVGGGVCGSG